jgi:hypothetical protein
MRVTTVTGRLPQTNHDESTRATKLWEQRALPAPSEAGDGIFVRW